MSFFTLDNLYKYTSLIIIYWLVLNNIKFICAKQRSHGRSTPKHHIDIKDNIIQLQCHDKCNGINACFEQCKLDMIKQKRRGECPNINNAIFQNISPIIDKLSCLENCHQDFDCPEVLKCCNSTCGPVCTYPIGLQKDYLLPPIPEIFITNSYNKVIVTIKSPRSNFQENSYYQLESRHHIGVHFSARKLGKWQLQAFELSSRENEGTKML